jgi:hypothetical protein
VRVLRKQPGFAATAVLTLALGIGANGAIFSLLNPLLFRRLPVPDPERLCRVFSGDSEGKAYGRMSYPNYTGLRDHVQSFGSLAASSWPIPFNVTLSNSQGEAAQSEVVWGAVVSGNYFTTLGVPVALGRTFVPEEDSVPDARPVMIVSHRCGRQNWPGTSRSSVRRCASIAEHSRSLASLRLKCRKQNPCFPRMSGYPR